MPGDALNFDQIYAEHRPMIRRYLARLAGENEADDLTQCQTACHEKNATQKMSGVFSFLGVSFGDCFSSKGVRR